MQGENWPIIDGEGDEEIFVVLADNVTIKGLQDPKMWVPVI
ncbi:MAG: hypothetical protein R2784_01565 [Saprospiraceae bacterium]